MKTNQTLYQLINTWSKRKFDQKCEGHYTGIEIYSNGDAQGFYMQRNRRTGDLQYLRWSNRKINIGVMWELEPVKNEKKEWLRDEKGNYLWEMSVKHTWFNLYFPPFSWVRKYKEYRKEKKKWAQEKALLDSGEYTMDPMGVIHHIDADQSKYYE